MRKRGKGGVVHLVITVVILLAVLHTIGHIAFYGTGVSNTPTLVSGYVVGKFGDEVQSTASQFSGISQWVIIAEWSALILIIVALLLKSKVHPNEPDQLNIQSLKSKNKTELDMLYELLVEHKKLRVSQIEKTFSVSKETAEGWCKILESGNIARLEYPQLGEPKLTLRDNGKK